MEQSTSLTLAELNELIQNGSIKVCAIRAIDRDSGKILRHTDDDLESLLEQLGALEQECGKVRSITPEELLRVVDLAYRLPSESFIKQAITPRQKELGDVLRRVAVMMAGCFFARVLQQEGDPIKDLLSADSPEVKLLHAATWTLVDAFEHLYKLIQILWEPISLEISCIEDAPANSFDLLLKLIEEHFDYCYEACLDGDLPAKSARKLADTATAWKTYFLTPNKLNPKQKNILDKQKPDVHSSFWISTVMAIAKRDIKVYKNKPAENYLSIYSYFVGMFFSKTSSYYRKQEREGGF